MAVHTVQGLVPECAIFLRSFMISLHIRKRKIENSFQISFFKLKSYAIVNLGLEWSILFYLFIFIEKLDYEAGLLHTNCLFSRTANDSLTSLGVLGQTFFFCQYLNKLNFYSFNNKIPTNTDDDGTQCYDVLWNLEVP